MAYVQNDNGRWVRTTRCSYCTGVGHNKRACPQLKARAAENPDGYAAGMLKRSKVTCGWCKTTGHNARTCPDKKGAKSKLKELEPLFKQHLIDVFVERGIGKGALVVRGEFSDEHRKGIVLSPSIGSASDTKFCNASTRFEHAEPMMWVLWTDGEKTREWTPRAVWDNMPNKKEGQQTRYWGYSSVKLLAPSNAVPDACPGTLEVQHGQTEHALTKWIELLSKQEEK